MGDSDTAAARLAALNEYFREHPVSGPGEGRAPTRSSGAPLRLATVDHIRASVAEVAGHTYAVNPDAGPVPEQAADVYDWCREHTRHADEAVQTRRDIVEQRQRLEHALRAGDPSVIRPHRCPECRTFGLMWVAEMQAAVCTNTRCTDRDGMSTTVALGRLAYEHVTAQKKLQRTRAT